MKIRVFRYLGKMIEVTREAPANLGTAMKTIIARFEDMKKDPAALIDGASANKVEAALATIGIALRDAAGEFRPLQDVFDELGMKWDSLTRNQQAYLATVAAGSRQQSRFLAMMNNYDRTLDLIAESQNSAGAALKQYETYQDSAAAATARLTAAWEEFYSKIVNSDMIVGTINNLTKLVEVMSKIGPVWTSVIATIGAHTINKAIAFSPKFLSNLFTVVVPQLTEKGIVEPVSYGMKEAISIGIQKWAAEKTGKQVLANGMKMATAEGVTAGIGSALKTGLTALAPILTVSAMVSATLGILVLLGKTAEDNAKKYENLYKLESKVNKEFIEQNDKIKQQKNDIQDNLEVYEEYENKIILSNEELQEQNRAVDILKENNDKLIVIVDELGKKHIVNKEILEEQTKELEQQEKISNKIITSNKLNALKKDNLQDLSVEQLLNSGYTQEEAELLNQYGDEIFKYRRNDTAFYNKLLNFTPDQNLASDIKAEMKKNKIGDIDGFNPWNIQQILQSGDLQSITKLVEQLKYSLSLSNNNSLNNVLNFIIEKAELAKDAIELINKSTQDYVKSLLSLNSEFAIGNKFLQNSFMNLFNNLDIFNNGDYFKQFENMSQEEIDNEINRITDNIQKNIDKLGPKGQNKFNELTKKLLDPTLSPNQKETLVKDFDKQVGEITGELKNIVDQYIAGSNVDIARREKLSESLGISQDFLKEYNSKQLQIIDQLRTANKNTNFNFGDFIFSDIGERLLKALSNLEHDITEDPSIYNKAQNIMVEFFKKNFDLNERDAYDTFQAMFGHLPELLIDSAQDAFTNAKNLILTDPTKALTKKQSEAYKELESSLGQSLDYYFLINKEGEEYLSIAGRIAIYEQTAQKYENALLADIGDKKAQQAQIRSISEDLTKEQQKQIDLLDRQIKLEEDKLQVLQETRQYTAQTTAALNNIEYATGYSKNIKAIKDAQKEMARVNGVLDIDTAKTLISMGTNYRQYLNEKIIGDKKYYTLTKENADLMIADQDRIYQKWLDEQKGRLDARIINLTAELDYYEKVANGEYIIESNKDIAEFESHEQKVDKELIASEQLLENQLTEEVQKNDKTIQDAETSAQEFQNIWSTAYTNLRNEWNELAVAMGSGKPTENIDFSPTLQIPHYSGGGVDTNITTPEPGANNLNSDELEKDLTNLNNYQRRAQEQVLRIKETIGSLQKARNELEILGPDFEDTSNGAGKTADEMKKLNKVLEGCADALEKLDKLLKDVKNSLKDINVDYNPFTDLFEAWEKEWDYYYNIKRLIQDLGQQGQYIDNIISADFTTADQKIAGYHAKIGNLISQMAANDTYITSLRTGMSQTALELMEQYGEYYKIDPNSGQIFQTDKSLNEINTTINAAKEELYNLSKVQNARQNDLNLENSKLEALEQEKSAYESILSELESQIDSYKNLDDVIVDTSELESNRSAIKAKIEITDDSIEAQKNKVRNMEEEIQNLEVEITLKSDVENKLEDYVTRMEDKVQEYEEYWDTLNSTIAEQQEILQQLNEVYDYYIDTAISTEQELYNAIVENYQNEINEKKKQYDYLKQLDKDYLASVKDNINKERQAREDANKQKGYQQSLQRLQLLQQDTSGAYRKEVAQLSQDIENQRQDLYDDLVDKQVEALEKEIDKRHELYDKEVAALEERLAYMQENAILLWEMVNNIVAEGADNMMALLENTTANINASELSRQRQRKQWEQNVKITFDGVVENQIDNINTMIEKGSEYVNSLKEIKAAMDINIGAYQANTAILIETNSDFQLAMNEFMTEWNRITNGFTGYYESWEQTVSALKTALDNNIQALIDMNNSGGSIKELNNSLRNIAKDMYNDFLAERQRYKDELDKLITQIQTNISSAVGSAANAISSAANSAQVIPDKSGIGSGSGGVASGGTSVQQTKYRAEINSVARDSYTGRTLNIKGNLGGYTSRDKATAAAKAYIERQEQALRDAIIQDFEAKGMGYLIPKIKVTSQGGFGIVPYARGGLANFTGPAWLDGSPSQPERILSPKQTKLFESMVSSLEHTASKSSSFGSSLGYNIGDIITTIQVDKLDNQTDINRLAKQVEDKIVKDIRNRVSVSVSKGV